CIMEIPAENRELILLEEIERDPDVTQASLAAQLGVAVGTVNWHLKRMIEKGYIKAKRAQRKKLRYIITPEGIALRARLTVSYIENSMTLYRRTRRRVSELLKEVKQAGYDRVAVDGDGDIADVCRLTCLEHSIQVVDGGANVPVLLVDGLDVSLRVEEVA
ncbi:MAG: winged helix-turn-helix transcriptional regulator, partial [Anaerolineales bacterium]|nr:winged helix-turn-helix transcriptional regulator [Anaerolineales bacterium]